MDAPPGTERQYYAGMKRKHQRTLELIFSRPVNGSLPWRDIEALYQELCGEVSERAGSLSRSFCLAKSESSTDPIHRPIQTRVLLLQSANGSKNTV
jgi:hypothetical protein